MGGEEGVKRGKGGKEGVKKGKGVGVGHSNYLYVMLPYPCTCWFSWEFNFIFQIPETLVHLSPGPVLRRRIHNPDTRLRRPGDLKRWTTRRL